MRLSMLAIGLSGVLSAQTYRPVNCVPSTKLNAALIMDATFSVKSMNIPFSSFGYTSGDYSNQVYSGLLQSMVGTGVYYQFGLFASAYAPLWEFILQTFSPWTLAITSAELFSASNNAQSHWYVFATPIDGNYVFSVDLKGGWDYPRNRVRVYDSNGNIKLDYDVTLSGDVTRQLSAQLGKGTFSVVVGLGTGSSTLLHSAGALNCVQLSESSYKTWTFPLIVALQTTPVPNLLPTPGSASVMSVSFTGNPPATNPNILDGLPIQYANLRPADTVALTYGCYCAMTLKSTIGCEMTYPTIGSSTLVSFDGITATYSIQRGADDVEDLDPPAPQDQ